MNNYKVAACVVTFNRIKFLKEIIPALKNQTRKPDKIFVIHNSGTDGTAEWLAEQTDLTVITQPNVGSSGGQYTAFKTAFEAGFDWIWIMDDDVVPRPECLENLLFEPDKPQLSALRCAILQTAVSFSTNANSSICPIRSRAFGVI